MGKTFHFEDEDPAPAGEAQGESFETALPMAVRAEKNAVIERNGVITGHAPGMNGTDPEDYLIGACLLDEGATLDKAIAAGLTTADLANSRRVTTYAALRRMREEGTPIGLDTLFTELGPRIQEAGGLPELMAISDPLAIGTTLHTDHYIRVILERANRRRVILKARDTIERAERGEELPESTPVNKALLRKPSEFSVPARTDRSVLLGNRYLNRGDGLIISGSSGIGKSSLSMQMAACWALATPFHGIQGNGPLKSLIVQSEDSDGDVAEVWASLYHVGQYGPKQRQDLDDRIRIVTDRVNRGHSFIMALKAHIAEFKPDLVWINPLQAFIDGDVTDSKDLGQFLREGLNGLNSPPQFGYILVHHTTKPATGKDRVERLWHEVMYDMAGGAELINWARGILSLRPTATEGEFTLKLAKRGKRAGVVTLPEGGMGAAIPTSELPLKHIDAKLPNGQPAIYWEAREPDVKPESAGKTGGRPEKFRFSDYRNLFPPHASKGIPLNELYKALLPNGEIQKKNLHAVCERWQEHGDVEIIDQLGQPRRYRAAF